MGARRRRAGRGTGARAGERLQAFLAVVVLLAAGALLGSFWLEWRHARAPGDSAALNPGADRSSSELEARPRVEVLNGAGERGAAREVADYLRDRGFDVVYFGNARHFQHPVTRVLDRSGRPEAAAGVARAMGVDSVLEAPEPELYLDVTLILGSDWRELLSGR